MNKYKPFPSRPGVSSAKPFETILMPNATNSTITKPLTTTTLTKPFGNPNIGRSPSLETNPLYIQDHDEKNIEVIIKDLMELLESLLISVIRCNK